MDLSTEFLNCNGDASHENNSLILFFGKGSYERVVHEKELVDSFHGCSVTLFDNRDDIIDFHTPCDLTVWHTVKSILVVDPSCK